MKPSRSSNPGAVSRRDFARWAALAATGGAMLTSYEAAVAQGLSARRDMPTDGVFLNSNENPLGPCPEAIEAMTAMLPRGGRYNYRETFGFVDTLSSLEGLKQGYLMPFAGSSDPLHRAVLAFTGPDRGLVVADPGYEAPMVAAAVRKAPVTKVPLRPDFSHDIAAMAKADPKAGVIYICNPNNPTGTVTARSDIEALVASKPEGSIILLDEAYIHYAKTSGPCVDLVQSGKDVIILRTFSKIYGMAGIRAGAAFGRPDLLEKLRELGAGALPATGMVAATASLKSSDLIPTRCRLVNEARDETFEWLAHKGFAFTPAESNCFMIDCKRRGREVIDALFQEKIIIGRTWQAWPNHVRVTVGTRDEMAAFRKGFAKVMGV